MTELSAARWSEQPRPSGYNWNMSSRPLAAVVLAVTLVSGHGGREKTVELTGMGPTLIERRLASAVEAEADRGRKERR